MKYPRIDIIIQRGKDATTQRTLKGSPTKGATLTNLRGAAHLPKGWHVVSTVYMPGKLQ